MHSVDQVFVSSICLLSMFVSFMLVVVFLIIIRDFYRAFFGKETWGGCDCDRAWQ